MQARQHRKLLPMSLSSSSPAVVELDRWAWAQLELGLL
jgi:hypothetical protein